MLKVLQNNRFFHTKKLCHYIHYLNQYRKKTNIIYTSNKAFHKVLASSILPKWQQWIHTKILASASAPALAMKGWDGWKATS